MIGVLYTPSDIMGIVANANGCASRAGTTRLANPLRQAGPAYLEKGHPFATAYKLCVVYDPGGARTSSLNFDQERSRSLIMVMESGHVMRNVGSS
jgi:hypothetical protein